VFVRKQSNPKLDFPVAGSKLLDQDEIVRYLLKNKLINSQSIVESDLVVQAVSRRNYNFKVIRESGPSYLVKMGRGPSGIATVAHEAKVYQLLSSRPKEFGIQRYLPGFYEYDPLEGLLILEYLHGTEDLRFYHSRRGRFPTSIAAEMGKVLGKVHSQGFSQLEISNANALFFTGAAWTLSMHRPRPEVFHEISSANLQIIKIIQGFGEFCELLDQLHQEWKPSNLIHYDIKWDNFLISTTSPNKKSRLKIVDWELARFGDPCWDIGSIFNDYLSFWLLSIPVTGESPPDKFIELARYPLEKMQPAIRSFWQSYVKSMELDPVRAGEWLLRSVRYGAVRLLQSAYEQMQTSVQLTGNVICLLQVSLNILQRPQEAIVHLLGIPLK
jgi:hypothetical protein